MPNSFYAWYYSWKYCLGNDDTIILALRYVLIFVPYFYHISELILTASCFYLPFRDGETGAEAHQKPEMLSFLRFQGKGCPRVTQSVLRMLQHHFWQSVCGNTWDDTKCTLLHLEEKKVMKPHPQA